jgi:hypothetical protein
MRISWQRWSFADTDLQVDGHEQEFKCQRKAGGEGDGQF